MKSTLIGHACLLIQSKDTTLLSDPVFSTYHWEEINVHCPSLDLDRDKIPRVDILNISHRHQDHFDVRTLAFLAKNDHILSPEVTVLAPRDEILLDVLKELEFKNIRVVEDFEPMEIKDFVLTPTPSLNQQDYFPEHGLLVHDGEVTLWNQVDTIVNPQIIQHIQKLYRRIDFAHTRYLPLLEGNFTFHKSVNLPFDEYSSFLKVVKMLGPKFIVPGSAGFRYKDEFAFLNRYTFPTTQEQFLKDLADFCPEVKSSTFFPGDAAEISPEGVTIERQGSDFIRTRENNGQMVEFKPVAEVTPIQTLTRDKTAREEEKQAVHEFVENEFFNRLLLHPMGEVWRHWKIVYQLEVFGNDDSRVWSVDFGEPEPALVDGSLGKINVYEGISYSEFYKFIRKETNWDFVGVAAQYRTFQNIYRVGNGQFEYYSHDKKFPLPLMEIFPPDQEMDREKFMKDVRRWKNKA
ncbi:MAG: MBL fold metallo-hydrolase [Nitrospinaceae bacterium]